MKKITVSILTIFIALIKIYPQSVEIKDNDANTLLKIKDEGSSGSIFLPTGPIPSIISDKMYNVQDTLFWNGSKLVKEENLLWKQNFPDIYFNTGKVGIGTSTPTANFHLSGIDGVLFSGTFNSGTIPIEGSGTRLMWYPKKAAFRSGFVNSSQWNDSNIGNYSVALGVNNEASGDYSFAMGSGTESSGAGSSTLGDRTNATGKNATAFGDRTNANSFNSTAIGRYNVGGGNATSWVSTDPLFEIGNGVPPPGTFSYKNNAFTVLKNGNIGINEDAPTEKLHVAHNDQGWIARFENTSTSWCNGILIDLNVAVVGENNDYLRFVSSSNQTGWITDNDAGSVVYSSASDARLKMNIIDLSEALEKVSKIRVRKYEMKSAPGKEQIGFLAQELKEIYPQAVVGDSNGNVDEAPMGIDYGRLTPLLLKAIQEQQDIIEELTNRIEILEGRVNK